MRITTRLDWVSNEALIAVQKITDGSVSGAFRYLIAKGEMAESAHCERGGLQRIAGAILTDAEMKRLKSLAASRSVTPGNAIRLMLQLHVTDAMRQLNNIEQAIAAIAAGEKQLVLNYLLKSTSRPITDATPRNERLLLWSPADRRWYVGRWNDDRFNKKPRPFWEYEGVTRVCDSRMHQPILWAKLPEDVKE